MGWGEEHMPRTPPNAVPVIRAGWDMVKAVRRYERHRSTANEQAMFDAATEFERLRDMPV